MMTPLQRKFAWAGLIAILLAVALVVSWRQMKADSAGMSGSASPDMTAIAITGNPDVATAPPAGTGPPPDPPLPTPVAAAATAAPARPPSLEFRPDIEAFYPPESRSLGEEGTSRLRVCFDDLGRVT